jgi:hypothetical protein
MPFVQPGAYISNSVNGFQTGTALAFALEGGVGGEYFISSHFSFGAQTGVALTIVSPKGANANVEFGTGTSQVFGQFLW